MLCVGALEEDAQSQDPLLAVDVAVVVGVEALEHAVQQDVVRHVEGVVQELPVDKSCCYHNCHLLQGDPSEW